MQNLRLRTGPGGAGRSKTLILAAPAHPPRGEKRTRAGSTSNPGLPRGEPGADKNVKRLGPKSEWAKEPGGGWEITEAGLPARVNGER